MEQNKLVVAKALILRSSIYVHLDSRKEGVILPDRLIGQSQVVLQVGLDMPVPIPDLELDDVGLYATLSFRGKPFACFIPWDAVFAIIGEDAKGVMWDKEIPEEVKSIVKKTTRDVADKPAATVFSMDEYRAKKKAKADAQY